MFCLHGCTHEHEKLMKPEEGNGTGVADVVSHHGRLTAESSLQPLENVLNKPHYRKRIHSRFKKMQ